MKQTIEVLAPAGTYDILKTAISAGADAVYAGGSRFGARAYAGNLTEEELLAAIDYVHLRGKKLYLTVNTLLKEHEISDLYEYLLPYYRQGLDAVIVQDMGVLSLVREFFPDLAVHASTQMTVTSAAAAGYLEQSGVERVVPARELSLREIRRISKNTGLEIECFVHGALCYCYSGQCLMSSLIGGRSGNRGQCAQPCRLPYQIGEERKTADFMSMKDLCTLESIPQLAEAGITSFKIEGRMKQADYVDTVVRMYRKYTDLYLEQGTAGFLVRDADLQELKQVYQRRGYTDGYYGRHNGKQMISLERPKGPDGTKAISVSPGEVGKVESISEIKERISGKLILSPERRAKLVLEYGDISVETEGDEVQKAQRQPMDRERLEKQMKKTGQTPFSFEKLDIEMYGDIFLPIQSLNGLRRSGLMELEQRILSGFRRDSWKLPVDSRKSGHENKMHTDFGTGFSVSVETLEQLHTVLQFDCVKAICLEDSSFMKDSLKKELDCVRKKAGDRGIRMYLSMARIFRSEARERYETDYNRICQLFDGVVVRSLDGLVFLKEMQYPGEIIADSSLYQWNQRAKGWFREMGVTGSVAPEELNARELKHMGVEDMELTVYGYAPVMVTAGCMKKTSGKCDKKDGLLCLTDRYKKKFMVKNMCDYCYNVIYNTAPTVLLDQEAEIKTLHPAGLRLRFTLEEEGQVRDILSRFQSCFIEEKACEMPDIEYTRGHFKRGVK